jgi:Flp pilus assembly protein CpaB
LAPNNNGGPAFRRPFTILGIVLALFVIGAFVLVAITAGTGQTAPQEAVVVAAANLPARVPIDAANLEVKSIPVGGFPSDALFQKVSEVAGMVPLVTIEQGEAITSNVVASSGTGLGLKAAYLNIPSGFVAYTLPTSEQQGVGGYIQKDDYIAVIATINSGSSIASATVFHDIHVIEVGAPGAAQAQGGSPQIATSLTVVVTECQAEYLTWFLTYTSLRYTLESYHDYTPANAGPDPKCASVSAARGVNMKDVMAAFPQLF